MWKVEKFGLKYVQAKSKGNCKYVVLRKKKICIQFIFQVSHNGVKKFLMLQKYLVSFQFDKFFFLDIFKLCQILT